MKMIKKFFGIEEEKYVFEWSDVSTLLTILNVTFILLGYTWAPWLGVVNCCLGILLNIRYRNHINMYVMQFALIILNAYFLTL